MEKKFSIGPKVPGDPESAILDKEKISPDDLGKYFLRMHPFRFTKIIRDLRDESVLTINLNWADLDNTEKLTSIRRLKEFLAGADLQYQKKVKSRPRAQERRVIIRGTEEQYGQASKFFAFNNDNLLWQETDSK